MQPASLKSYTVSAGVLRQLVFRVGNDEREGGWAGGGGRADRFGRDCTLSSAYMNMGVEGGSGRLMCDGSSRCDPRVLACAAAPA